MRVDGPAPPGRSGASRKAARGGFRLPGIAEPQVAAEPAAVTPIGLAPFGAVAPGSPEEEARRARRMLDALGELQQALLGDGDDRAALHRLAALAAEAGEAGCDPALTPVLDAVRLRVAIELAKRGFATDP